MGYWIVEFEQNGEDRAKYGDKLLTELAKSIRIKGLGRSMLNLCRLFYKVYPEIGKEIAKYLLANNNKQIIQSLSGLLQSSNNQHCEIIQTLSGKSYCTELVVTNKETSLSKVNRDKIFNCLSFSHIAELLSIDNQLKRSFYEIETIKGCWSVRELRHQIDSLCFERAGISKKPEKLIALINEKADTATPSNIVKSPYIFDFLGLRSSDVVEESDLENLLITHIQDFILELGEGFCFEARQKRILIDNEYFFVDLVFYHRILKCHVLVELKTQKFNYADMAQLNMYVSYYRENMTTEGDNAPIGILLCTPDFDTAILVKC